MAASDARIRHLPVGEFLERMAKSSPVPGGGSAAALAGASAAALVHMVVELSAGRPTAADHEEDLSRVRNAAISCQSELLRLAELDAAAYDSVVKARRMPRDTELEQETRRVQIAGATREATTAPLQTARSAEKVLGLAEELAPIANRHAISDVGVAALLATAAIRGAGLNVRINLPYLAEGEPLRAGAPRELDALLEGLDERQRRVLDLVEERMA